MSNSEDTNSHGRTWFEALVGTINASTHTPPSVLMADAVLGNEHVRYLAVVPDPNSRFPRVRRGELGLLEAWALAKYVREVISNDKDGALKRPLVAIVDTPGQAYGRVEEVFGSFLACAAAVDAYATARLAGHPVVALIVGDAISGAFLAHGYQANRILAFAEPHVQVHAMSKSAAARVTKRTVADLDHLARHVTPMSYDIHSYARLGTLHKLILNLNADAPSADDVERVRDDLAAAIADARSGPRDLGNRLTSAEARVTRAASLEVRKRLVEEWELRPGENT